MNPLSNIINPEQERPEDLGIVGETAAERLAVVLDFARNFTNSTSATIESVGRAVPVNRPAAFVNRSLVYQEATPAISQSKPNRADSDAGDDLKVEAGQLDSSLSQIEQARRLVEIANQNRPAA
jgi:hypothetical protein